MSKYTPGPWRCSFDGHGGMRIESIEWQIGYASSAGGSQEANANLMATAPELLDAARQAESDMAWAERAVPGTNFQSSLILLRAAIRKATGG